MDIIELKEIFVQNNRVTYKFDIPKAFEKYFEPKYDFFIEYPEDIDLNKVPEGILAVPFAANMMLLTIVQPVTVKVKKLDKAFYNCIDNIADGFSKIYPAQGILFNVTADETVDCEYRPKEKYTQFFTGGVDATSALIENIDKKPELINIWGGDILLEDADRYEKNKKYFESVCGEFGLEFSTIKSSLRFMFDEPKLDRVALDKLKNTWWAAVSHNIAMNSLMAPFAYLRKIKTHFIASSYSESQKLRPCCNYSFINNPICFGSCNVEQTDPMLTRDDKINKIKQYYSENKKGFHLYVCHHPVDGDNCSSCEKCYRTIMSLIEKRLNPNHFGFTVDKKTIRSMRRFLFTTNVIPEYWKKMQNDFIENRDFWRTIPQMRWFLRININSPYIKYRRLIIRAINKVKRGHLFGKKN